jgi:catechol O-methyltransferase
MSANADSDPFESFGKEMGHDERDDDAPAANPQEKRIAGQDMTAETDTRQDHGRTGRLRRNPEFGVLTHHSGTESALLQFVLSRFAEEVGGGGRGVDGCDGDGGGTGGDGGTGAAAQAARTIVSSCETILALVDEFCTERHWMMHVGDEKGRILEGFLGERLQRMTTSSSSSSCFCILELGTYCGYSLIRMAKTVLQRRPDFAHDLPSKLRIVTIDISAEFAGIAQRLVKLAGLEGCVSFVVQKDVGDNEKGSSQEWSHDVAGRTLESLEDRKNMDFVFIDHDKDRYLPDLLELEASEMIGQGTFVAADNVVFFRLNEYRAHMKDLANRNLVRTRLVLSRLEYSGSEHSSSGQQEEQELDLQDGLGK